MLKIMINVVWWSGLDLYCKRWVDLNIDLGILHCGMPKLVEDLFDNSNEGFYNECGDSYDMRHIIH
jgi:hypothetical protein